MKEHKPLTQSDIGRVYVHGTSVRVVLVALNSIGSAFMVHVKCVEPTEDGEYITTEVDSRNLAPTDEWPIQLALSPVQAVLLHSIVRESGWGYTESGVHAQVATDLLEIADLLREARTATGAMDVKRPDYHKVLFDAQFEGVSDSMVIMGEER